MLSSLQKELEGVKIGKPESLDGKLASILSSSHFWMRFDENRFGKKNRRYVREEIAGIGAVRETLKRYTRNLKALLSIQRF